MYIWDLETKEVAETEHIRLADIGILSLIKADCQVLRIGLMRQTLANIGIFLLIQANCQVLGVGLVKQS